MTRPPFPPPRQRTPSGHDIPIPESVFTAIAQVQAEGQATRAEVAGIREDVSAISKAVAKLAASKRHDWAKIITAMGVTIPAIIGGVRLAIPTPAPERVEVIHTPVDPRMGECASLRPGTQEQAECFARVQAEIQSGRRP